MDKYYAVTTLNLNEGEHRSRLVGCFPKLEEAQQCCTENWGDIYENGWYPYVVVEELEWGLYPDSIGKRWFYNWLGTVDEGKFVKCEPPEGDDGICSYYG